LFVVLVLHSKPRSPVCEVIVCVTLNVCHILFYPLPPTLYIHTY
jgi:hypothetical protein